MVTREDIENEAADVQRLIELSNPTHGAHTPTPWKKGDRIGDCSIETETGLLVAYFRRKEDRDLALYFANVHPGMILLLRNVAAAFAFIGGAAEDAGLQSYAFNMVETTTIYTDLFCRMGKLAGRARRADAARGRGFERRQGPPAMIFRTGDRITIRHRGRDVPGRVELASENQVSLAITWDAIEHEAMIAGCLGTMPLLRDENGVYRCLMNGEAVDIRKVM
jgi:hypothetical protein